jgi:predicted O-methyltransferase YrrM
MSMRQAAKVPRDATARLTGLRATSGVIRFMAEDAQAFAFSLMTHDRAKVRQSARYLRTDDECFDFSRQYFGRGPVQHRYEISSLLTMARENGTQAACEIGAFDGGTSALFIRALDLDLFVVMDLYVKNRWRLRQAAPKHQTLHVVDGDSTHPLTTKRLRRKLAGRPLDLLLIDGDHSWSGVRRDFLTYRELVRDGGVIAFHDICATNPADPNHWAGGVPDFWKLISALYPSRAFIETPGQEGFGIGAITYSRVTPLAPIIEAVEPSAP